MFSTIIFIILTWTFVAFIFIGIGILLQRAWGELAETFEVILDSFWLGFAFLVFILQLWNFWFPVNRIVFYILIGVAIIGYLLNFRFLLKSILRINIILVLLIGIAAIFLAAIASLPMFLYDHGLYYSNLIQWAESFHIVKGLGNLYSRLAYNNSYYLFAAFVETFPWIRKSHHFVTGALLMGLLPQIIYSYFKILGSKSINPVFKPSKVESRRPYSLGTLELQHIFYVFMFWPVILLISTSRIASPGADAVVSILQIVIFAKVLVLLDNFNLSNKKTLITFFCISIFSILGICIKASMLAYGLGVLAISVSYLFCFKREFSKVKLFIIIGIGFFIGLVPCMLRNVLVSGYIFYPMAFWGFPVNWRIPSENSLVEIKWVMSWARAQGVDYNIVLGNMDWFWPWLKNNWQSLFSFKIPVILSGVGLMGILFNICFNQKRQIRTELWLMFIPVLLALVVWFLSVPDIRFSGALFWILGISLIVLTLMIWISNHFSIKIICTLVFMSAGYYVCTQSVESCEMTLRNANILRAQHVHINSKFKIGPARNDMFNDLPEVNYSAHITDSGLILFSPDLGEDCWDMIPCTPRFNKKLQSIIPGDLASGFVIEETH